jgi:hypothetical protein
MGGGGQRDGGLVFGRLVAQELVLLGGLCGRRDTAGNWIVASCSYLGAGIR